MPIVPDGNHFDSSLIYDKPQIPGALRQCELLSSVARPTSIDRVDASCVVKWGIHPFSIVLSQSCDLEQDYLLRERQMNSDMCLACIFLAPLWLASDVRVRSGADHINTSSWSQLRQNDLSRFHFLEAVPAAADATGVGIPELVADFKQYFSLPVLSLYEQLGGSAAIAARRTILRSPYLEHFAVRFFAYQSRIALPRPHATEPIPNKR